MERPALEVAEIFRDHGAGWREANRGHVSLAQLKVMSAIEACRTATLGGHVARCENDTCGHTRIAYNSCLMGKNGNGEADSLNYVRRGLLQGFFRQKISPLVPIRSRSPLVPGLGRCRRAANGGHRCWRRIFRRPKCSAICEVDRAGRIWTVSRLCSKKVAIVRRRPCAICARRLISGISSMITAERSVRSSSQLCRASTHLPMSEVKRRPAQSPHGFRRQAFPRFPCRDRCLPAHRRSVRRRAC
jgi:hypothetical protein